MPIPAGDPFATAADLRVWLTDPGLDTAAAGLYLATAGVGWEIIGQGGAVA